MASDAFKTIAAGLKEAVAHSKGRKTGAVTHRIEVADIDVRPFHSVGSPAGVSS